MAQTSMESPPFGVPRPVFESLFDSACGLFQRGEFERATGLLQDLVHLEPSSPGVPLLLGAALRHCGDFAGAIQAYSLALERMHPSEQHLRAQLLLHRGSVYLEQGRIADAHEDLTEAAHFGNEPVRRLARKILKASY